MNPLENHGIIIRELRRMHGLSVRSAAGKLGRAVGWLSEIENGRGTARLTDAEFDRIVAIFDGAKHRSLFKTWIANLKNQERVDKTFDGAILKHIRIKKELSLVRAAKLIGFSACYLSMLERGTRPMTLMMRNKIMRAYGYSPSSFKNLSRDPIRSKAVPSRYKFEIWLRSISQQEADQMFSNLLSKAI